MYKHLPSPVNFREDINGLRAWAVIAVLLFHFSLIGLPGGFVGVDIFFVISGYLMTAIVVSKLEKGTFSLLVFYMARVRRILPALLVVIATLLMIGWFWLPTPDYQELGKESAYSLAFLSNIGYWRSSGYFDSSAHEKWLLHTWTLAVEAQFYVLYPIFITILWKFWPKIKTLTIVLLILFILSFTLNVILVNIKPTAAFYLLPTRGWEFMAGGLVYLLARRLTLSKANTTFLFWLGWLFIFLSLAFITKDFAWPGYWAIFPVLGASFIIFAKNPGCKLTNNAIAQWLGNRSYSLYLWHWPLVVLLYYYGTSNIAGYVLISIILSLILSDISYRFIETPTRFTFWKKDNARELKVIIGFVIFIFLLSLTILNFDLNFRNINQSDQGKYLNHYSKNKYLPIVTKYTFEECNFYNIPTEQAKRNIAKSCVIKNNNKTVFLWGDSHLQALAYGLNNLIKNSQPDFGLSIVGTSGCKPSLKEDKTRPAGESKIACDRANVFALKSIKKTKPFLVIMAQKDKHDQNNYENITKRLISYGVKNIILIGPVPQWTPSLPQIIARRHWNSQDKKIEDSAFKSGLFEVDKKMQQKAIYINKLDYISPIKALCNGRKCLAILDKNKTPLVWDYGHLSPEGSMYVANKVMLKKLEKALSGN